MTHNDYSPTCTYLGPEFDPLTWRGYWQGLPTPYCGCPSRKGSSYCEQHYLQMYQKGTALRKRHKDIRRANAQWDLESEFNSALEELLAAGEV